MLDTRGLQELISIDSPAGFTHDACNHLMDVLQALGYEPQKTHKGAIRCALGENPRIAIAAHVDTLGAIVTQLKSDGSLRISPLGGLSLNMAEGEYVRIHTLEDHVFTGTFLLDNPSLHANREVATKKRQMENMHIRVDELVNNAQQLRDLGIRAGDIVCFDPRYQELASGFIKSRFLDNKAGCFVLLELAKRIRESGESVSAEIYFSNYEEVGHGGACGYSKGIEELLVVDMGVLGNGLEGDERKVSICAKDSTGPYDYHMRKKLVRLAEERALPYAQDVYPYYGSDGSAALAAGNDFRVALIGPGVAASHGVERTHILGIEATIDLCHAYVLDQEQS